MLVILRTRFVDLGSWKTSAEVEPTRCENTAEDAIAEFCFDRLNAPQWVQRHASACDMCTERIREQPEFIAYVRAALTRTKSSDPLQ